VRVLKNIRHGAVAISPDGKVLLAGGKLLDFGTGKELRDFGHEIPVAAFSLDSRRLVTGSGDASLLVWDVARLLPPRKTR
jgi:WD40 repeat protein